METILKKKKSMFNRRSKSETIVMAIAFVIMLFHICAILYVFLYGVNLSLKWDQDSYLDPEKRNALSIFFDKEKGIFEPRFGNYLSAFTQLEATGVPFFTMVFNSLWYSLGGTLLSLTVAACSTYIVAKYKNAFTRFVFNLVIFLMIFPVVGSGPSLYKLYTTLGFDQTPLILLSGLNNMCNLMMYAFFTALPWTYAEAAFIDGANDFQVFWKIMLPMALPSISVLFVTQVITMWNDYTTPLLYLDEAFPTLSAGLYLYEFRSQYGGLNYPVFFAGVTLSMIPPILLFAFMQNTIMSKVYFGGLKG
jgi:raffinose/stachyose/melibiose transport system permease protein/N-acetylglucosamine transport system permease protein